MALQGLVLWVPIEKLFMTQTASMLRLLVRWLPRTPPWCRCWRCHRGFWPIAGAAAGDGLACLARTISSPLGGLSQSVIVYVVAAMIVGVYFAFSSGP